MPKSLLTIGVIILIIAGAVVFWSYKGGRGSGAGVTNFDECAARGYPVLESYPRQCKTPDGRTFTEDIGSSTTLTTGNELEKADVIRVAKPRPNESVKSPLIIEGEARGPWFFEATFPIKLIDENGNILARHYAQAKGEWMTDDFVPFGAELNFAVPNDQKATLVLEKDNPSGLPEHSDELRIPVILQKSGRMVELYYYNPDLDKDESGNIMCSRKGLAAVEREIPVTQTPVQDAIRLLISGELITEEQARGITTEYPLEGFALKGAFLKDGVLTLEFDDLSSKTVGGACRVGILWFQIEATAKQFPEVQQVRFMPEELFQP